MCGVAGFISTSSGEHRAELGTMLSRIIHRGPDAEGVWLDQDAGVALGHRRLSVLDLSPQGHQPMMSACGRYVIVFNGEIYNHAELRRELESAGADPAWRGHSDTEVMLAEISHRGLTDAVQKFVGMFAFALWDRKERVLHLVRDRLGEKPLYYGWSGETFLFGSELKALRAHSGWRKNVCRDVLALYLRHNYVPAPYTIYEGVFKLLPGTCLSLTAEHVAQRMLPTPGPYWSARRMAEQGVKSSFDMDDEQAVTALEGLLKEAVGQQMVADVPLGAFLSGGVDSSTVVALMQSQSRRPVRTFTIGFRESDYNEAEHAEAVARHLGTEHTELYVSPDQARDVIPELPRMYDEPFADSSQIPTLLVSRLTRQHVTVSLSGDGGDELFGGYNRYFWGRDLWRRVGWLPKESRAVLTTLLRSVPPQRWDAVFRAMGTILPERLRQRAAGDKMHKLAAILAVNTPEEMYRRLVSHWDNPDEVVINSVEPLTALTDITQWAGLTDFTQRMMYLDLVSYLPDDILVKVDRAAMAVSLETRVPMLDHRVVEFAWSLPLAMKIRNGQGKWLLKQVLYKYVPKELIERPKMGFGVPLDSWLRGPLRDWAESLLDEARLRQEGYFDPAPIRRKWVEHLSGRHNWQYHIWDILMFQSWISEKND